LEINENGSLFITPALFNSMSVFYMR